MASRWPPKLFALGRLAVPKTLEAKGKSPNTCIILFDPRVHAKGVVLCEKDVFLPSKHLLSAFYETLPSKNPSTLKTLSALIKEIHAFLLN